jgi:hypothetical protein
MEATHLSKEDENVAGPELKRLLADITSSSSSPQALQTLKKLQHVPKRDLKGCLPETVQCIEGLLQDVSRGSVRNIPRYLYTVGKAAEKHPRLLEALQGGTCREVLMTLLNACAADGTVYKDARQVSQLCCAQYSLQMCCKDFWQRASETHMNVWNSQAAVNFVYAYGKLHSTRSAPDVTSSLEQVLRAGAVKHADDMVAQGVANTLLSFATLEVALGEAQKPLMRAVVRVADSMVAQNVDNTLWAFAKLKLGLGEAHELVMKSVVRVTGSMNAQGVANTLWALAKLELWLGEAHVLLMKAILRVADSMNAQDVANTLWAVGTLTMGLGPAHDPLLKAVPGVSGTFTMMQVEQCSVGLEWLEDRAAGSRELQRLAVAAVTEARQRQSREAPC